LVELRSKVEAVLRVIYLAGLLVLAMSCGFVLMATLEQGKQYPTAIPKDQ